MRWGKEDGCKRCKTKGIPLSVRGLCKACGALKLIQNLAILKRGHGVLYNRWRERRDIGYQLYLERRRKEKEKMG